MLLYKLTPNIRFKRNLLDTNGTMAMIDMSDLSRFTWPEVSAPSKPRNLSNWRDVLEMTKGLRTKAGTGTDATAIDKHRFFTEKGFCRRNPG